MAGSVCVAVVLWLDTACLAPKTEEPPGSVGSGGLDERDMWALALHQEKESVAIAHHL
jgi:hypothetical protein